MNRKIKSILTLVLVGTLAFSSCKKDETKDEETNVCGDMNLCFKVGEDLSFKFDAKLLAQAQEKYKIYSNKDLGGVSNERMDLAFKSEGGLKTGEYSFVSLDSPLNTNKTATFEYYKNIKGDLTNFKCVSGKLTITKYEDRKISGKFSCNGVDKGGKDVTISSGSFTGVSY